jgi:Glycosyl transferase family 2
MTRPFSLSVAIPVHNETSVLPELLRRLRSVLDQLAGGPHQIVFVDDGSTDGTFDLLAEAARQDPRILALSLSRNFGHQAAITAGLDHVTGDEVVVMDGDLQDVPEIIPQFVEKFHDGYDVVYAKRVRRKEPWLLRLCYFLFYRMMASLSDIQLPLDSVGSGKIVGFAGHRFEEIQKHLTPLFERAGEFAAIGAREKQGNRGVPGKSQLQNVNVAVIAEQASEIGENSPGGRVVHVMKETVDEDEIEALVGRRDVGGSIMGFETQVGVGSAIATFGIANVFGI